MIFSICRAAVDREPAGRSMGPVPSAYGAPRRRPARDDVENGKPLSANVIPAPLASEARERDQAGTQYAVHNGGAGRSRRPIFAASDDFRFRPAGFAPDRAIFGGQAARLSP